MWRKGKGKVPRFPWSPSLLQPRKRPVPTEKSLSCWDPFSAHLSLRTMQDPLVELRNQLIWSTSWKLGLRTNNNKNTRQINKQRNSPTILIRSHDWELLPLRENSSCFECVLGLVWVSRGGLRVWAWGKVTHPSFLGGSIEQTWNFELLLPSRLPQDQQWHWALVHVSSKWKESNTAGLSCEGPRNSSSDDDDGNRHEGTDLRPRVDLFSLFSKFPDLEIEKLLIKTSTGAVLESRRWLALASGVFPGKPSPQASPGFLRLC